MARNRVDDEEALIPRSDQEEFHPTVRKKRGRCCGIKVCFFLFLLLVLGTIIVFYFVYPSYVTGAFDSVIGYFRCDGEVHHSIACVVVTAVPTVAGIAAIKDTWGTQCRELIFIYKAGTIIDDAALKNQTDLKAVDDVNSFSYLADERLSDVHVWVLKVDATTYVSSGKIQKLLTSLGDVGTPKYVINVTNNPDEAVGVPYVMNGAAVVLLRNEANNAKDKTLKEAGVNEEKLNVMGINTVNTILSADISNGNAKEKLMMKKASIFYGLKPEQMYMSYLISGDSV